MLGVGGRGVSKPLLAISSSQLDFRHCLIVPTRTSTIRSRSQVKTQTLVHFEKSHQDWIGTPIWTSNMDSTGTIAMYDKIHKYGLVTCFDKNINKDLLENDYDLDRERYSVSTGINIKDIEIIRKVIEKYNPKFLCVDVANGYMEKFISTVAYLKTCYPDVIIVAGNVVTPEVIPTIGEAGADIIKLGIGSGSVCTTRIKTGIGCPQLSAILNCHETAHNCGIKIMSDGGIQNPGDICKAYAAGADFVMVGGLLAGHADTTENVVESNGQKFAEFYGMSSKEANNKYSGGMKHYKAAEGKKVLIPLKDESITDTIEDILGGVRSCCSYLGAFNPSQIYERSNLIKVEQQVNDKFI